MALPLGVVVSIPKEKWEVITAEDLEKATPEIREGDIVIVNTGWHRYWGDSRKYFVESPGTYDEAGAWLAEKKVKGFGIDCQALDHPLGTAIGPQLVTSRLWNTLSRSMTGGMRRNIVCVSMCGVPGVSCRHRMSPHIASCSASASTTGAGFSLPMSEK